MVHAFTQAGMRLLADVESGAVHVVDRPTYDVVRLWIAKGRSFAHAQMKYSEPGENWDEIFSELDALVSQGSLFSPPAKSAEMTLTPPVKAMCLHAAHDCDLRCRYCFASTGSFHGERALLPLPVGKAALDFLVKMSGGRRNLEVDFFGGEPLLNWDTVKALVHYGRSLEPGSGKRFRFTVTTNAMALTEEILEYCNQEMDNVVLSLDGRKEVHDRVRLKRDGSGSFDVAARNAALVAEAREALGLDYFIRGTFTSLNLDFCKDVLALADMGFKRLSMEPAVLPPASELALRPEHLPAILAEYDLLAEAYELRRREGRPFSFFHFEMDLNQGPCRAKRVAGCGAGGEYVAVTPSGDIYPCHQFAGERSFRMGNVQSGDFDTLMQARFRKNNVETKTACASCWAKYYCSGGCAAHAYHAGGDIRVPPAFFCELERKRTEVALALAAKAQIHG